MATISDLLDMSGFAFHALWNLLGLLDTAGDQGIFVDKLRIIIMEHYNVFVVPVTVLISRF
jgi:hypothetical protein